MYRFAVLPYANAAPLIHFLPEVCPGAEMIRRPPRQMLAELRAGRVDAAIVPVADFFSAEGVHRIDGLGIAADGDVESVLLQCRTPLEDVASVALDPDSRTANALCRVLLREHVGLLPRVVPAGQPADAEVVIGDRALLAPPARQSIDLAGTWRAMTGLPFVFAVWACRSDHPHRQDLSRILHASRRAGGQALPHLAELCARRLGLPLSRCRHYLESCIRYDIGRQELAGMELFRQKLQEFDTAGSRQPVLQGAGFLKEFPR